MQTKVGTTDKHFNVPAIMPALWSNYWPQWLSVAESHRAWIQAEDSVFEVPVHCKHLTCKHIM